MKIIVLGDSWAMGEWGRSLYNDNPAITHNGLSQYLEEDGHEVIRATLGGQSNTSILDLLEQKLEEIGSVDFVFWFQTDPMRDILFRTEKKFENKIGYNERTEASRVKIHLEFDIKRSNYEDIKSYKDVINKNLFYLKQAYEKGHNIAERFGIKIHCIGGLGKLNLELMKPYSSLVPLIESLLEFIYPNLESPEFTSLNSYWRQILLEKVDFDSESINYFYKQYELDQLMQTEMCREYFYPDGTHPNRKAHKVVHNQIKKILNI